MIEIREIHSKKDIKTFVDFPTKLYKGVAEYSYPLRMDELNMFNPKKNLAYKDCEVDDIWFNLQNFGKWYEDNFYQIEGEKMCLDKDILVKGNKIYSPNTCIFVPKRINELFTKTNKNRGKYPIGISWKEKNKKFQVQCSVVENERKTMKYLGLYTDLDEAFKVYKDFKENYIKQVADEYKDKIPEILYKAMYKYKVNIND